MESRSRCAICGAAQQLLRCAKCKQVYYCSAAHQQQHWPAHKPECRQVVRTHRHNNDKRMHQLQLAVAAANLSGGLVFPRESAISIVDPSSVQQQQEQQLMQLSSELPSLDTSEHEELTSSSSDAAQCILQQTPPPPQQPEAQALLQPEPVHLNGYFEQQPQLQEQQAQLQEQQAQLQEQQAQLQEQLPFVAADDDATGALDAGIMEHLHHEPEPEQLMPPPPTPQFSAPLFNTLNNRYERSLSYQIGRVALGLRDNQKIDEICDVVISDLNQYGMSVIDDFLGTLEGLEVLNDVQRMYGLGVFQDGQLVNDLMDKQDTQKIRGDKITWVHGVEQECLSVGKLINQIDAVIYKANMLHNNGLLGNYNIKERTKAMVACYPGYGTQYLMHIDNPNKDGRVITAIYYLNVNWDVEQSGGALRIYPELPQGNSSIAEIEPKFDRLIFFWSDKRNPHEVQPAHRTRYAITVWYFDAEEREAALQRAKYKNSLRAAMGAAPPTTALIPQLPPTPPQTPAAAAPAAEVPPAEALPDVLLAGSNNILTDSNSNSMAAPPSNSNSGEICT